MARGLATRGRFAVAYLVLGAAVGIGIGTFIVLLQRPGPKPPGPWSSWRPAAGAPRSQLLEIANHVGSAYLMPSGDPLAAVKIGGPERGENVRAIIVPTKSNPRTLADFDVYDKQKSVVFTLCGLGRNCKITEGTASTARGTVLRREALELALYTLEYVKTLDNVLVFVPPARGQKKLTSTLFFHRGDLSSNLRHPLRKTLPHRPPLPGRIAAREKETVDSLTPILYRYVGILPANGFGKVLVIQPT